MIAPAGFNNLIPAIERILRDAEEPLDCHQIYEFPEVKAAAASANRVSDYLGILFRRGLLSRVASDRGGVATSRTRWAYIWKNKEREAWKTGHEATDYKPKAVLDRPNIYIAEDGRYVSIELPHLSITIKTKE